MPRLSAALLPNTPPRALPLPTHITTTRRSRHQPLPCRCTPLQPAVLTDETDAADLATQAFPLVEPNALQSQDHSPPSSAGGASTPATSDLATVNIATLAKFLLPTLAIWLIGPILSLVDTAVVGATNSVQLAALAPGTMLIDYTSYFLSFLAMATTNMLAIAFAKRDRHGVMLIVSDALIVSLLLGTVVGAVFLVGAPSMLGRIVGSGSPLLEPAAAYVQTRALGFPFGLAIHTLQAFFLAAQYPTTPLLAAALAGLTNLAGDLLLVNGLGMGVVGAAAATVAAQALTAGMLYRALVQGPQPGPSLVEGWTLGVLWRLPSATAFWKLCRYAGPVGGVLLAKTATYGVLTSLASSLGALSAAAHHVTFSVFIFFAVFGDAVSQAAQTFLPAAIGRPAAAWAIARRLVVVGALLAVANAVAAASIVLGLSHVFTNTPAVAARMADIAWVMGGALLVQLSSMATEGMLLAGRDLLFLLGTYVANAAVVVGACRGLSGRMDGLVVVWWCVILFQANRLVVNWARLLLARRSPLNTRQQLTAVDLS